MRIARRIVHVLLIVLTLVVGASAAAIIVTQTAWFKDWLRGYIVREAKQYLNGNLTIQRLGGNLFFGVEMENIGVSMDGSQVVAVKDLGVDYNVFDFITKGLSVDDIRMNHPVIYLRREGDTWSIARLVKKQQQEADRSGPGRPISIDRIGVSDGSLVIDGPVGTSGVEVPKRIDRLDAQLSFKYEPVRYSIEISHVSFRGSEPSLALNALSGGIAVQGDAVHVNKLSLRTAESSIAVDGAVQQYLTNPTFNVQVSSDKLSIPEIARVVPSLAGIRLQPAFEIKLDGPLDRLGADLNVRSSAGQIAGRLVADVVAPAQSVNGSVAIRHLNLEPILRNASAKSDITADLNADIAGESFANVNGLQGTLNVDAPRLQVAGYDAQQVRAAAKIDHGVVGLNARASAYGAGATANGRVTLPPKTGGETRYDMSGELTHFDMRRLPRDLKAPPASTDINAAYHVAGAIVPVAAASAEHPAVKNAAAAAQAGAAAVTAGIVGTATAATGKPPAAGDGQGTASTTNRVQGDLRFHDSQVAGAQIASGGRVGFSLDGAAASYNADATIAHLDLERTGREFGVAALSADRYRSDLNLHVIADGSGTSPKAMNVTADATLTDSTVMGGRIPSLRAVASLANDVAHVKAGGSFDGYDPAALSGRSALKGTVGGTLDVDADIDGVSTGVTTDNISADAKLNLQPSTVGGLDVDRAALDATYFQMTADIRTLDVAGRDLNLSGSGTLALSDSGQSNFKLHVDTPDLSLIGKLVDQPLTGIAKVDATVTGNRTELQATGNVTGDGVSYGDNGALTLSSDYKVAIPDLDAKRAAVTANTHGTFVKAGSLTINEVAARTDYANNELTFDATARQPQRSLHAAGELLLHPDHQEVHLQQLGLESAGQQWQLAPRAHAAIEYGGGAVTAKDVRLVNGSQEIAAQGGFGQPGDTMKVTLTNIDLSGVDALLLRPPQLTGRANATTTISGTKEAPRVAADFSVTQGAFRQFHYDAFNGKVDYSGRGATVDAKLQQNPSTWLAATGYLPTALFSSTTVRDESAHGRAVAPGDRIDFHIKSSPIDLALVQGFTTELTNVKGVLHADIDVIGSAEDPHATGNISVENGAFTVATTGVPYTGFDGRIDLQPDRIRIDDIRVLDNQQKPLTISGELAVHERQLGGVTLSVKADDFKVIDNKMGKVRINSDLRFAGDLRQPRLEGDLGITTGQIDLDPVLALVGTSAYATKQTEYATGEQPTRNNGQRPPATGFGALSMNVHVTVPDDLVIKANDLKAPGAPIGLGTVNLTLGGDLRAEKNPGRALRLVGTVNTVRGFYDFQSRRFTILRDGTVQFVGLADLNPTLNIRAQRLIQGVQANVNVTGTMREPKIELSSVPPLDQGDILALIVFNQPLNQLGEGAQISLTQRAEQMASGAIANTLARSVGTALGLDQFEIQMAPDTGSTAQLTVGEQVGQNLYVKVQQGIGDIATTNFILEYELNNWLRLQSNLLEGAATQQSMFQRQEGSGVDLIFFFSY